MVSGSFPYRFIATSLGSQCGTPSLGPHTELVRYTFEGFISPLPWLRRTSYHTEIIVNALPIGGQVERISSLRVYRNVRTLLVFNSRSYATNFAFHSPTNNPVAWDGLPGGTRSISDQARINPPTPDFSLLWFVNIQGNFTTAGDFCFVPTFSALDVTPTLTNTTARYTAELTTASPRPVAGKFIAQAAFSFSGPTLFNFPHPFFPGRQAQWIFNEMQDIAQTATNALNCNFECPLLLPVQLSGAAAVCSGQGSLYQLVSPPEGVTQVIWDLQNLNGVTVSPASSTSPSFAPTFTGATNASVTIRARVYNKCGLLATLYRSVLVGSSITLTPTSSPVSGGGVLNVTAALANISFTPANPWSVVFYPASGGAAPVTVQSAGSGYISLHAPFANGNLLFTYTINEDDCGYPQTASIYVPVQIPTAGRPTATATLYPNPARETVDVYTANASPTQPVTVRLFDAYGRPCAEQSSTGDEQVRLATDKLPAGLYFVHILRGQQVISREQLRIEK